jgi:acetyl-CoA acetyltransferase
MDPVYIAGVGMTRFGVLEESLVGLAVAAATEATRDASVDEWDIAHLFVGCQNPDEFTQRGHLSTLLADRLGLVPAGATRLESGPSSGASAFEAAFNAVASGCADV